MMCPLLRFDRIASRLGAVVLAAAVAGSALIVAGPPLKAEEKPAAAGTAKKDAAKPASKNVKDAAKPGAGAAAAAGSDDPQRKSGWDIETGSTAPPPAAGNVVTQDTAFDDWLLKCAAPAEGKQRCVLIQRLADAKGRKIVLFKAARAASTPYLEVNAPLGLSIPFGIALVLPDGSALKMELADCNASGCRAVVPLSEATIAKLKSDQRLGVRFQDSKSGKVLTVNGSLKGFANGVAKLLATAG